MPTGSWALRVRCPFCGANESEQCVTAAAAVLPFSKEHRARWVEHRYALSSRRSRMRLKNDDPRFHLAAGDVLVCERYWLDPGKWTVLYRESDGFDPECNQYGCDVEWIGWAS